MTNNNKLTSQELNEILAGATNKLVEIIAGVDAVKSDMNKKLIIIKHESDYAASVFNKIQLGGYTHVSNTKVFMSDARGQFDQYGATVHPKFIATPWNVYNLKIAGMGKMFFRDDVAVRVNNQESATYTSILKHDSIEDKDIFFEEFFENKLTIDILPNTNNRLGSNKFNIIEIDSFLYGSYDISKIQVYGFNNVGEMTTAPILELPMMPNVGKQRIILPEKIDYSKITIHVDLKYLSNNGNAPVYPFGLKHIYLYEADFVSESYVITTITNKNNIASISDLITVISPFGEEESTFELKGMTAYISSTVFDESTRVIPSTQYETNEISKNVKALYVKVPLVKQSLIGTQFNIITR